MTPIHLLKISRLEGLTDGIFAIAMTIMVLNLHVPTHLMTNEVLPLIAKDLYTNLFIGSFIILGTHWIAMNFQIGLLDHLNRVYLWANLFYLMTICIVPFSANLLGAYPHQTDSIYFYAANLLCGCLGQLLTLECAHHFKLNKSIYTKDIRRAALQRILVAPPIYISSVILAHWSINTAFILLILPTIIYMIPGKIDRYENRSIE